MREKRGEEEVLSEVEGREEREVEGLAEFVLDTLGEELEQEEREVEADPPPLPPPFPPPKDTEGDHTVREGEGEIEGEREEETEPLGLNEVPGEHVEEIPPPPLPTPPGDPVGNALPLPPTPPDTLGEPLFVGEVEEDPESGGEREALSLPVAPSAGEEVDWPSMDGVNVREKLEEIVGALGDWVDSGDNVPPAPPTPNPGDSVVCSKVGEAREEKLAPPSREALPRTLPLSFATVPVAAITVPVTSEEPVPKTKVIEDSAVKEPPFPAPDDLEPAGEVVEDSEERGEREREGDEDPLFDTLPVLLPLGDFVE